MAKITKKQQAAAANEANLKRIEEYVKMGNQVYTDFLDELAKMAASIPGGISAITVFNFDNFPALTKRISDLISQTTTKVVNIIDAGIDDAALRANGASDALVDEVFNATNIPKTKLAKYYNRNLEAAATRKTKSQLSKKVYKITKQFKQIAEAGIDNGIASGKNARDLATEIKKAVKEPEFAYRRVRNKKGNLEWSKNAKKYAKENPPGTGKYLNPQKNYERLTRTEVNMSYRTTDHNRVQDMDFVVGIRINLSTNPNHCPFCIKMAGDYPKNFLWRSWHPQCRCYKTTILKTRDELDRDNELIFEGKQPLETSVNTVKAPPEAFSSWVVDNEGKLKEMAKRDTLPYFIQDNYKKGDYTPKGRVPGTIVGGVEAK